MMRVNLKKIIDFRQKLHRHPELSGKENYTAELVKNYISNFSPDFFVENIGQTPSFAVVFDSNKKGKTLVFRAELDALPIQENNNLPYRSTNKGVSHKCGHDGHLAILTGLAEAISYDRPKKGKVVLLFQSAEETLQGAISVMDDPNFKNLNPDVFIGFHNIPFFPENTLIIKDKEITSATNGLTITLLGKSAHASEPSKANSPLHPIYELIALAENLPKNNDFSDFVLVSPTFLQVGTPNFGIIPDKATAYLVLRAFVYKDLDKLIGLVQDLTKKIAKKYSLDYKISYSDDAPPVLNDPNLTEQIIKIAQFEGFKVHLLDKPFAFAEDFGYYTLRYKGVFFGLGNGLNIDLHSQDFDFPDNIIFPTIKLLFQIYKNLK